MSYGSIAERFAVRLGAHRSETVRDASVLSTTVSRSMMSPLGQVALLR